MLDLPMDPKVIASKIVKEMFDYADKMMAHEPNQESLDALQEASDGNLKTFDSVDDLFNEG